MELGNTIKTLRQNMGLSQEELADAVYVTRQTVSNWENDKSYPDIKSLLLLANFFGVSLDILVKGDVEKMKEITKKDIKKLRSMGRVMTVMMILLAVLPIPLVKFLGLWGLGVYVLYFAGAMWYALRVEKFKKENDLKTYREIEAFMDGKRLDEANALREEGKYPYQRVLAVILGAVIAVVGCGIMWLIFK